MDITYQINIINSYNEILNIITQYNNVFEPSLSDRGINLVEYSKKLYEKSIFIGMYSKNKFCIGFAAFYVNYETKKSYLALFAIEKKYRHLGLGKELFNKFLSISKEKGMNEIELEVSKNNIEAINFYKKRGLIYLNKESKNSFYMGKSIVSNRKDF